MMDSRQAVQGTGRDMLDRGVIGWS